MGNVNAIVGSASYTFAIHVYVHITCGHSRYFIRINYAFSDWEITMLENYRHWGVSSDNKVKESSASGLAASMGK